MRMHVLQHVPFEGPGAILDWAEAKGAAVGVTRFWEAGWTLPSLQDIDLLVVMGGPMGVHDEAKHPWLAQEKNFIAECIGAGHHITGRHRGQIVRQHEFVGRGETGSSERQQQSDKGGRQPTCQAEGSLAEFGMTSANPDRRVQPD